MKDTLEILWLRFQITRFNFQRCILESIGLVHEYISKFIYLYLMDEYKRTDYRNFLKGRIRELKAINDPNMELSIRKTSEIYQWMCDNQ